MQECFEKILSACQRHAPELDPTPHALLVTINEQRMHWFVRGQWRRTFAVSTSRKPPCHDDGSLGTPPGLHHVADKIGDGCAAGTVFKGRQPIAGHWRELPAEQQAKNLITSRILRLRGNEAGVNTGTGRDSFNRYIYIHGTNQEDRIGQPNSHGCVLMRNAEVVELYEALPTGTPVLIDAGE